MELEKIKSVLAEYLTKNNYKLFDVTYHKSEATLSVILDEKLDMDQLEQISNMLSEFMDNYEQEIDDNYILDVSTVGLERPIRSEQELVEAIDQYIYVKTKEQELYGYLKKFENGILSIAYKDKTRDRMMNVEYIKIKKVRYAVKF